jgi:hypothetical protein
LLLLILIHVCTSVFCPVTPLFPCICWSVFVHSLCHAVLHIVLLSVLGMLILYGLLSHQVVFICCCCCCLNLYENKLLEWLCFSHGPIYVVTLTHTVHYINLI